MYLQKKPLIVELENEVTGVFVLNGDSNMEDVANFVIYRTKGILKSRNEDLFGGDVIYIPNDCDIKTWGQDKSRVKKSFGIIR